MYIDAQIVELYWCRFNLRGGDGETLASSWCGIILWLYSNLPSFKTNSKLHTLLFTTTRTPRLITLHCRGKERLASDVGATVVQLPV